MGYSTTFEGSLNFTSDMTTEEIARMNAKLDSLYLEEGLYIKLKVGSIKCSKSYLKFQQKLVNHGGPGAYPAFLRVVELIKKLKE